MTSKNNIESGLIELYVLDVVSENDKQYIEQKIKTDYSLKKDIKEIEYALYRYAELHGIHVRPKVKKSFFTNIKNWSLAKGLRNRFSLFILVFLLNSIL